MNKLEGYRHRLKQIEEKVDFVMKTVTVSITFNNPADPNVGKTATVPLGALFDEIKRMQGAVLGDESDDDEIDQEIARDRSNSGADQPVGVTEGETIGFVDADAPTAPVVPAISPSSGIIITG